MLLQLVAFIVVKGYKQAEQVVRKNNRFNKSWCQHSQADNQRRESGKGNGDREREENPRNIEKLQKNGNCGNKLGYHILF